MHKNVFEEEITPALLRKHRFLQKKSLSYRERGVGQDIPERLIPEPTLVSLPAEQGPRSHWIITTVHSLTLWPLWEQQMAEAVGAVPL